MNALATSSALMVGFLMVMKGQERSIDRRRFEMGGYDRFSSLFVFKVESTFIYLHNIHHNQEYKAPNPT
jgi:hypothetical protein